ncbi:hypothetical protein FRC12_002027 [Ceratobasidium sp. 428]|nr:hypothetical protein FRC12_002027 [Ceratobasidium sp. 428]
MVQTRTVCVKCGRGEHAAVNCKETSHVDERERAMRGAILRKLNEENRAARRAGALPGTPTPAPRVRDLQQLEESDVEEDTYYTDFYDSENE